MNYLAHAHLSFHHPDILVGNMISDFVKGKNQYSYPLSIQKGIRLHRSIDAFTDLHPATREARQLLAPAVGAYAGAFMDIVYDHFLALDKAEFPGEDLMLFSSEVYEQLHEKKSVLPEKFAVMLPFMQKHNWLYHYQFNEGIEKSFSGLARRAKYLSGTEQVFDCFLNNYAQLQKQYAIFFPFVKEFASEQFEKLLKE